ncbi:MAG: thiamine pyrophosphate-binding protein, partial [Actinobacteria bacterium]|nr:thiamine pyrophosphate-binding protein [Actinomycetota bacterium]
MKISDYIIDFLFNNEIDYIFEVVGGSLAHIIDSLYSSKHIKTISMHHEQAAAFAAEGYSRASGNFGVALATSGPGATNL